jgi:IS5 family transposase
MLGKPKQTEPKLFYHGVSLERRMPLEHPLRRIKQLVDFDFIRSQVADLYGTNGNQSVDPAVILKLMFLLFYENIKSERALLRQLPLRLDWLWFCDYDLDEATPDHSVLSKARNRWGSEVFEAFFMNILEQCINAGLVDGETIYIDSSTIDGNADIRKAKPYLRKISKELTGKLDDDDSQPSETSEDDDQLGKRINPSDPDARIGCKYGKSTLGYKDHRVVDDKYGIITTTITTPANIRDDKVLKQAVHAHEANTSGKAKTVVADKIYGTIDNYKFLHDKDATPCISHPRFGCKSPGRFSHDQFHYDRKQDCYVCPAGQKLTPARHRGTYAGDERYRAERKTCEHCRFFSECVSSKTLGRQICHRTEAKYIEWADNCLSKSQRKSLMSRRKYKAEGSFADGANNYGFKRARWRGGERMEIQNLMIAAIQNLGKLMRYAGSSGQRKAAAAAESIKAAFVRIHRLILELFTTGNSYVSEY